MKTGRGGGSQSVPDADSGGPKPLAATLMQVGERFLGRRVRITIHAQLLTFLPNPLRLHTGVDVNQGQV